MVHVANCRQLREPKGAGLAHAIEVTLCAEVKGLHSDLGLRSEIPSNGRWSRPGKKVRWP